MYLTKKSSPFEPTDPTGERIIPAIPPGVGGGGIAWSGKGDGVDVAVFPGGSTGTGGKLPWAPPPGGSKYSQFVDILK